MNAQEQSLHDSTIPQKKLVKFERWTVFSGFLCVCLPKPRNLRLSKLKKFLRQESYFEKQKRWSQVNHFFSTLVALCLEVIDELKHLTTSVNLSAKYYWQECRNYMQECRRKLKRPPLDAIKIEVEQKRSGSHLPIHWRIHTLSLCRKSSILAQFNDLNTQIHTI